MAEKKTTKKVAATSEKKVATKKVAAKAAPAEKKVTTKTEEPKAAKTAVKAATKADKKVLYINAETAGFRAGDVYQALAAANGAMTLAEVAKVAKISKEEALLGIGWLFKEGKLHGEGVDTLALA